MTYCITVAGSGSPKHSAFSFRACRRYSCRKRDVTELYLLCLCAAKASAYRKTNQAKARRYGRVSLKASIAGIVIGVVILVITVYRVANMISMYNRQHRFPY